MPEPTHGRALIESRFGPLGKGQQRVMVNDAEYDVPALLARMDLAREGLHAFDVVKVADGHFCIRYYDSEDQRIVAQEFDSEFRILRETRGHIAEWIGEDAYYDALQHPERFFLPDDFSPE